MVREALTHRGLQGPSMGCCQNGHAEEERGGRRIEGEAGQGRALLKIPNKESVGNIAEEDKYISDRKKDGQ